MGRWTILLSMSLLLLAATVRAQDAVSDYGQYRVLGAQELDLLAGPEGPPRTSRRMARSSSTWVVAGCVSSSPNSGNWVSDRCPLISRVAPSMGRPKTRVGPRRPLPDRAYVSAGADAS